MRTVLKKIFAGGNTGADRGGLDAAIMLDIPHGGFCPKWRRAEDGRIPDQYQLTEVDSYDYTVRTRMNVEQSDATVVFVFSEKLGRGTGLTVNCAKKANKPCIIINLRKHDASEKFQAWIRSVKPAVLNVAGTRESNAIGIQRAVRLFLFEELGKVIHDFDDKGSDDSGTADETVQDAERDVGERPEAD